MSDVNTFFDKIPTWIRWILALPAAIAGYFLARFILTFSTSYVLGFGEHFIIIQIVVDIALEIAGIAAFFIILYYCLPKYKYKIMGILAIILDMISFTALFVNIFIVRGLWIYENLLLLFDIIVFIVLAVKFLSISNNNDIEDIEDILL